PREHARCLSLDRAPKGALEGGGKDLASPRFEEDLGRRARRDGFCAGDSAADGVTPSERKALHALRVAQSPAAHRGGRNDDNFVHAVIRSRATAPRPIAPSAPPRALDSLFPRPWTAFRTVPR